MDQSTFQQILDYSLAIGSFGIGVISFIGAIMFYLKGRELQDAANKAMIRIDEKASNIQSQVGGVVNKSVDALIALPTVLQELLNQVQGDYEEVTERTKSIDQGENESPILKDFYEQFVERVEGLQQALEISAKRLNETSRPGTPALDDTALVVAQRVFDFLRTRDEWVPITEIIKEITNSRIIDSDVVFAASRLALGGTLEVRSDDEGMMKYRIKRPRSVDKVKE